MRLGFYAEPLREEQAKRLFGAQNFSQENDPRDMFAA